jgi:hypothetical protein
MRVLHRGVVGLLALFVVGCGTSHPTPKPVYRVAGKVTYKGKPAPEVRVFAVKSGEDPNNSEAIRYEAQTNDDGEYSFGGYFPTLSPGKYDVRVVFLEFTNPDKYNGRKPAFQIDVKAEEDTTVPPFDLK